MGVLDIAHKAVVSGLAVISIVGLGERLCAVWFVSAANLRHSCTGFLGYGSVSFFIVRPLYQNAAAPVPTGVAGASQDAAAERPELK